mgnify:CR=1 FL=1
MQVAHDRGGAKVEHLADGLDDALGLHRAAGVAFQQPVPPKGLNLDFPLSEDMKALFKTPNDKALD